MPNLIGIDCADDCSNRGSALKTVGISFVGRYYRWPKSKWTPLTYSEAASLTKAGLQIVALWEWQSDAISNFSYHDGFDQGSSAYRQAMLAHQPSATPIYFAVDSDFRADEIAGPVGDYFRGVADSFKAMGGAYNIGAYGSGLCCAWLLAHQRAANSWLAESTKWQGHDSFAGWDINQSTMNLKIPGMKPGANGDYDSDEAKSTFGGFTVLS